MITESLTVQQRELLSRASLELPVFHLIGIMELLIVRKKCSKDQKALAKIIAAIFNQISKFKIFITFLMHLMCRLLIVVKPSTFKGSWMVNYANVSLVNLKLVHLPHFADGE